MYRLDMIFLAFLVGIVFGMGIFAAFVYKDGCNHKWGKWEPCMTKTSSIFQTINGQIGWGQSRKCELCGLEELKK
jgi:hypothetical protein